MMQATRSGELVIETGEAILHGDMVLPPSTRGLVIFAHGSGSSRFSPRNRQVAEVLNQGQIGTLLFDLLTEAEEEADIATGEYRFNIKLLSQRLVAVTDWVSDQPELSATPLGYFGASTGAAAALSAAAHRPHRVSAVVSRGGRPDLAADDLPAVRAPTLLIVGGEDQVIIEMNEWALEQMSAAVVVLEIVPGATHLFGEPGALDHVARLALDWFQRYLGPVQQVPKAF